MTALLVVGSAPCLDEDLAAAKALYPDAHVLLVNGACAAVERAEYMLAGHTDKANEFLAARLKAFPNSPVPEMLANWARLGKARRGEAPSDLYPCVKRWFGAAFSSGATSAGKAALMGLDMGYEPVILVGCPMDGSGYSPREGQVSQMASCQRIGDRSVQDRSTIRRYKAKMRELAATTFKGKVFSMSGYTRDLLGAPPGDWL